MDLKRIVEGLKKMKDDDRKYCKLVIPKYYDVIYVIDVVSFVMIKIV